MAGTWFGHGQPGDRGSMYIDRMRADGTWRGEYRTCRAAKAQDQVQTGHWLLTGDTLLLRVDAIDGMAQPRTDSYRMLSHDAHAQRYLSLPSQFAYSPSRVADSFQMPGCELIS